MGVEARMHMVSPKCHQYGAENQLPTRNFLRGGTVRDPTTLLMVPVIQPIVPPAWPSSTWHDLRLHQVLVMTQGRSCFQFPPTHTFPIVDQM